jgi:hypothetical protein
MARGNNAVFILNIVTGVLETLLSLRLILRLFGANAATPFVSWVYLTSAPLLTPFSNIFPSPRIEGLFVMEIPTLFALAVYAFLGYFLVEVITSLGRDKGQK